MTGLFKKLLKQFPDTVSGGKACDWSSYRMTSTLDKELKLMH